MILTGPEIIRQVSLGGILIEPFNEKCVNPNSYRGIGSHNQCTLQLNPVQPVRLYPGMLIGQVTFWTVIEEIVLYQGRYQGAIGPVESKIHMDFEATPGDFWMTLSSYLNDPRAYYLERQVI